jgi:anti-sigma B factor antagonist
LNNGGDKRGELQLRIRKGLAVRQLAVGRYFLSGRDHKGANMRMECDQTQDSVVCHVVGDLEHLAVPQFQDGLAQLSKKEHVVFELSGVPHVDSVGLGALIRAIRRTRETGGEAVVCAASPTVKEWLEIVAVPRTVNMFDNLTAAQAYLRGVSQDTVAGRRAA